MIIAKTIENLKKRKDEALETKAEQRLLLVIKARWFLIGLLAFHGLIGIIVHLFYNQSPSYQEITEISFYPTFIFLALASYNLFFHLGWHKLPTWWKPHVKTFIFYQLGMDIAIVLLLIHFSGGVTSWLWPLLLVINLELTFLLSAVWQILLVGSLAGAGYSLLGFLEYNHYLSIYSMPYFPQQLQYNPAFVVSMLFWVNLICSCACFVSIYMHRDEHKKIKERVVRDGLTSLYNRRYFNYHLNSEIKRAQRYGRVVSLIMFDLDNFKQYNDTFGHVQGDALLQWIANIFKLNIRCSDISPKYEIDIACRYGGEEFAIILPETDSDKSIHTAEIIRKQVERHTSGALSLAERIRTTLESAKFRDSQKITISAGIASFPTNATNAKELIEAADKAMYIAKNSGKNKSIIIGDSQDTAPLKKVQNR